MKAFANYHPAVLLAYFLSVISVEMFAVNPVFQLSALLGGILFCCMLSKRSETAGNIGFYIPMFLLVAITNPLFSHNGVTPLFFLNGNPVTLEAFVYGAAIAVTVIGVMLWCKCFSKIMTSDKLLYLFGKVIPKLSLVLSMALRFIPLLLRRRRKVSEAQKAMGMYSGKSFTDRLHRTAGVFMAMISWSFENAMETSASMKARGYGLPGRTNFSLFKLRKTDILLLGISVCLLSLSLAAVAAGDSAFYYYPRISGLGASPLAIAAYLSFALLSFLPFIIETREALVWKYFISKI